MVFSSLSFLFGYLPITLLIMKCTPRNYRNILLFIVSLVFYGYSEPVYIILMLVSTIVDYVNGYMVYKYRDQSKKAFKFVLISVIFNIGLLSFFKYYDFIVLNLSNIGLSFLKPLNLALPLGISFYTFQTMSYPIDVYRNEASVQKNIFSFGAYVSMFPQLIAGPIVRYKDIADQLDNRKETMSQFFDGINKFLIGLCKKVLLANSIGAVWDSILKLSNNQMSVSVAWLGIIAFGFQIYFDFSGYSDMAIGLGKMLGFDLPENFNYPYISRSISEFWRRWHITLGQWFKNYVYIPLGGSRSGFIGFNLFAVWFLTGLWHGASWNFILWGLYFWVFIFIEKKGLLKVLENSPKFIGHIYTLLIVFISWTLFYFESLNAGLNYLGIMFNLKNLPIFNEYTIFYLRNNIVLWVLLALASIPQSKIFIKKYFLDKYNYLYPILILLALFVCTAYLVDSSYNPFLYFRF
ncbi:MAG: MBOAT family O-acyltransferase [Anaerorhabdus sp.]